MDHNRVKLGSGRQVYEAAKSLCQSWGHFQLGWTDVDPKTPVKAGAPVCVRAQTVGLWTANPLKIVYVSDGPCQALGIAPSSAQKAQQQAGGRPRKSGRGGTGGERFSYAHGCLNGHFLAGEERFAVEWSKADDSVWYEVYTFSKPGHPLALLSYPLVRFLQHRFAHDSINAVRAGVAARCSGNAARK